MLKASIVDLQHRYVPGALHVLQTHTYRPPGQSGENAWNDFNRHSGNLRAKVVKYGGLRLYSARYPAKEDASLNLLRRTLLRDMIYVREVLHRKVQY